MSKTAQFFARVPQEEYNLFVAIADLRGETPSSLLRRIVRLWLSEHGDAGGTTAEMRQQWAGNMGRIRPR